MGGMKDYQRGFDSGYTTGPSRIPRTFAESVGHDAGRAQRQREMHSSSSPGDSSAGRGISFKAILIGIGIGFVGLLLLANGGISMKLLALIAGIVALVLTKRVRRVLGVLTPIYIGLMIGFVIGCLDLLTTSSQLNLYNLGIFLFLGAACGSIGVPIAMARKRN